MLYHYVASKRELHILFCKKVVKTFFCKNILSHRTKQVIYEPSFLSNTGKNHSLRLLYA